MQIFVMEASPGEKIFYNESLRTLWSPIVNSRFVEEKKKKTDSGVARYNFTSTFLMENKETDADNVWNLRKRALMDL